MQIEVKQLSECQEYLTTVGTWIFEVFLNKRHKDLEVVLSWLRLHTQKDRVPYTEGRLRLSAKSALPSIDCR